MLALYYVTLQCGRKNIFRQIKKKICQQKVEKTSQKSCILMTVGSFFSLSAALTAQNSPELHFCFINSPIQSSVLKSVLLVSLMLWYICFLPWWFGAEIKITLHVTLPKRPTN